MKLFLKFLLILLIINIAVALKAADINRIKELEKRLEEAHKTIEGLSKVVNCKLELILAYRDSVIHGKQENVSFLEVEAKADPLFKLLQYTPRSVSFTGDQSKQGKYISLNLSI
jgi:hypothetical protein